MLDLDRARPVFRGLAIAFYLVGALLAFLLLARLFGHWTWGLAGGLLWIAAPGLVPMSIQFRPDVLLAVVCLVFAYLVGRAVEARSAALYAWAAFVAGLAVMVKLHAAGLLVPLLVGVLWRPPRGSWERRVADVRAALRRRRAIVTAAALAWLALTVLLNSERVPFSATRAQLLALLAVAVPPVLYALVTVLVRAWRAPSALAVLFQPSLAAVWAGFAGGLLLPVTLELPDGLQALVNIGNSVTGSGVNEGVDSFATPFSDIVDILSHSVLLVLLLAGVAGVLGLVRRDPRPVIWASGAITLGMLAFARPPAVHYFAPAFVLALPAALWVLQRERGAAASLLVWPVIFFVAWPSFRDRDAPALESERFAEVVAPSRSVVEQRLQAGEVVLVPPFWPFPDSRYFELVRVYVDYSPERRYRYLPISAPAAAYATEQSLRPRYYIGPQAADVAGTRQLVLGELGEYTVRRVSEAGLALELLAGPGADRLWQNPEARYDPETGYFKDREGRYLDRAGSEVPAPPRRRFVAERGVWVDQFGDLWNRYGIKVGNDPSLRTG